ncbi:SAGA-associated factor 29 [Kwoniella mangroviensis CBS 10435]|uniref:SAGA-associated factor 29 n=1 Tax=Kwoniella mangroviensis CBS 10435 TaxID=1331196 RepID=A0A1B9IMT4_9TREE|nr:SAGA-associated factor 29 [Kwoniella mangroviensis CBS 8507]OCF56837.1 SAGA-associated factor 29 [Kwoniella mangroviensis CBS 10435]OCF63642.1 SAGA-associated factor 29 [Kwoniella mangroviensis CBS 8507]OCF75407.1 SAGA-associated factor 29 [Kwoniella mangroviensis CBS 8886]
MSRNRLGSVKASAAEHEQMNSLWHSLVDTLRLLPSVPTNPSSLKSSSLSENERERNSRIIQSEKKHLDEALDKLNVLLALRRGPGTSSSSSSSVPPEGIPGVIISNVKGEPSYPSIGTPTNGVKKKRKLSLSASASPAPADHPSPMPMPISKAGTPLSASMSTSMSREATGKQLREIYWDQLPLQPGRRVAFRLPKSKSQDINSNNNEKDSQVEVAVPGGGGGDDWILATIKRCIQMDKMRYEVQDVDDGNAYNTTLRSIIPLPDPTSASHLSSHPTNLEDFPRDSQVLALYPDTTSFYRATVVSPPLPGTGNGLGLKTTSKSGKNEYAGSKKGVYRLSFVDDDGNIQEVGKDDVVAVS